MSELQFFKEQARESLLAFSVYNDQFFEIQPHHELIAESLEKVERWEIKRLRIEMPPRSGKSRMVQEFIAWYLWRNKGKDVIYTWHSISLLQWFSRNIRNRINSDLYKTLFNTNIQSDSSAVNNWNIEWWWEFAIFWVGWWITGKGFHVWIIDDPYSSREDAESDTIREKVFDWYNSTFYSRRQNQDAAIIMIMQRWREDDLAGQIEEQDGKEWTVIKIPAIDDTWKSFWDSKFSVEDLQDIRKKLGDYFFMSQYQQDPINEWGGTFKREYFQNYIWWEEKIPLQIVTFVDPAISTKDSADFTAIVTIGLDRRSNNIFILDVFAERIEPDALIDNLFRIVKEFWVKKVGLEVVQYQKMLALEIKKQMRIRDYFFVLDEIRPMWEKESRIKSILQPRYANGSILHKKWMDNLELELLKFPNWKHDDMIDALSWAVRMLESTNITDTWSTLVIQDYWLDSFLK